MIIVSILLMILLFIISLFSFYGWDYYMKITHKPMLKSKFVRLFVIHYGRQSENEIRNNNSSVQLPCEENLYSVSKTVLGLEIGNLIYAIAVFVLCGLYLTRDSDEILISALILLAIYLIGIIVSIIICIVKTKKTERLEWGKKYEVLRQMEFRNEMTLSEAEACIFEGKRVCFNLYGLDFLMDIYPRDNNKIELLSLTHQRILTVSKDLKEILNAISINQQSLNALWKYLKIKIKDSTCQAGV